MPPVNKTTWTKQSAVLLINIVKDVEQKILKKQLQVGKENEKTKWDYVAALLHDVSESDASKTSTNCQYKFWELNRHYKFLLKGAGGKTVTEEKEGAIFAALKAYYELFPSMKRKSKLQRGSQDKRIASFSGSRHGSQKGTENPEYQMNVGDLRVMVPISSCNEAGDDSGHESGGSLHNLTNGESVRQLLPSGQAGDQSGDESGGSPYYHANAEAAEHLATSCAASDRAKSGKRKAIDQENLDLVDVRHEEDCSYRIKQMVDKMARLTSYIKWKQTGVGEDWRCDFTDRIERRAKRNRVKQIYDSNQVQDETEIQVPDEIENALREDILSYWNELDKKRPTEEECQRYFLKKYAGEVRY